MISEINYLNIFFKKKTYMYIYIFNNIQIIIDFISIISSYLLKYNVRKPNYRNVYATIKYVPTTNHITTQRV